MGPFSLEIALRGAELDFCADRADELIAASGVAEGFPPLSRDAGFAARSWLRRLDEFRSAAGLAAQTSTDREALKGFPFGSVTAS